MLFFGEKGWNLEGWMVKMKGRKNVLLPDSL